MPVNLLGSTSGYTQIVAAAVAGNNTLTLPTTTGNLLTDNGSGSLSLSGNLAFTGTGNRITGEFSTATYLNRVLFQSSTTNGNTSVGAIPNGTSTTTSFVAFNNSDPTNAGLLNLQCLSTEARVISGITGTGTYLPMTLLTGGTERMRIDSSGNVGIGTSTTGQGVLTVYSGVAGAPATTGSTDANIASRVRVASIALDMGVYSAGQAWIQNRLYNNYASNYDIVLQPNGGNVGIGTSSPSSKLDVAGNGNFTGALDVVTNTAAAYGLRIIADSANTYAGIQFTNNPVTAPLGYYRMPAANVHAWYNSTPTERMRIDSSGNVQVGGTTVANTTGYVNSRTNARAWCNFDGTLTGTITPRANYNVSSVTKNGTGDYTINFTTSLADANYVWAGSCPPNGAETVGGTVRGYSAATQLAGSCRIRTLGQTTTAYDTTIVNFMAFGN